MKPYKNNDEGIGMGEGDMSDGEAEALLRRYHARQRTTTKSLLKDRIHREKMRRLAAGEDDLSALEGGQQ